MRDFRRLFRLSNTVSAIVVLAVILPIPAIATFHASRVLQHWLHLQREVREAQLLSSRDLRLTIDQEAGVRGYTSTGNRVFLQSYEDAAPQFDELTPRLKRDLRDAGLPAALELFADARRMNKTYD